MKKSHTIHSYILTLNVCLFVFLDFVYRDEREGTSLCLVVDDESYVK